MRSILLGTLAILIMNPDWSRAVDDTPPAPTTSAPAPVSDPAPAVRDGADSHPWNPDIHHANVWPYDKPIPIDSDYVGPPGEFWLRAEYYLWNLKGERLPPLATAGPTGSGGLPGQPGVGTVIGGSTPALNPFSGGKFTGGVWFESSYTWGFEGSYFFLAERSARFTAAALGLPGTPDLGLPFVNVLNGQPASVVLASSGLASGSVLVRAPTELQGGEAALVWNICRRPRYSVDCLAAFRYLEQSGQLAITDSTALFFTGTRATATDFFSARNHFYGGEIAGRVEYCWRSLVLGLTEKLALGGRTTDIQIAGNTVLTSAAGAVTQTVGGLLTQPSNIGKHSDDAFAVVNEVGIQVGWRCHDCLQVFAGYTFLYLSSLVRPEGLVDLGVNLAPGTGGPARPAFSPRQTDFWAHGLNAGLELRY